MSLDELLEIIQKSKFQSLLDKNKFNLVYKKHEFKGGIQDSYLIGFESSNCKLGFHCGADIGAALVAKSSDWDAVEWIDLEQTISYLRKQSINRPKTELNRSTKYAPNKERFVDKLSAIAEDFELLFDRLVVMFQDKDAIAQWKPELEEYIKEDTKRKYGIK